MSRKRPRRLKEGDDLLLFRHFQLIRTLGRGSCASVYQVRRLADDLDYALKHIDISALPPSEYADLANEIRLMAAAQHPNLAAYREAWVEGGQLFLVVELAAGGDLGTLLGKLDRRREGLPETAVWRYFLQLAAGLQYLHHNRVLHRDMKPENVLIAEGGLLKIADLGISQVLDRVFTRVLMGTPQYVAPEAWQGKPYSYSADVWALGCVLHELCTRRPLFLPRGRPSDREIAACVLEGRVAPISRKYSPDLWKLIKLLLARTPADRPTMDEVMGMEMVQARLHLLPEVVRERLESSAGPSRATMPRLFRISAEPSKWPQLNAVLPPAQYAVGRGVAEALRPPRAASCPDLTQLAGVEALQAGTGVRAAPAEAVAAGAEQGPALGPGAQAVTAYDGDDGGVTAAGRLGSASGVSALFRFSQAYPAAREWAAGERLRRASTSIAPATASLHVLPPGRPQPLLEERPQPALPQQQHDEGDQVNPAAEDAGQLRRCRSLSNVVRAKPLEGFALSRTQWACLAGLDAVPLDFGSPSSPCSPGSGVGPLRINSRRAGLAGCTLAEYASSSYGGGTSVDGSMHGGASYYEASYHRGRRGGYGSSHAGSYGGSHAGSYKGSYHGNGLYYDSSHYGGSYASSLGGSYHGGSYRGGVYHNASARGGAAPARAAAAKHAMQQGGKQGEVQEAGKARQRQGSKGGGFGAKLKKLLFGKKA